MNNFHDLAGIGDQDAVVLGGGFYGVMIAIYLAKQRHFKRIALIERESALLTRASYNNQARVHNGYHYPRSFTTAYRSRVNLPKFVRDFPDAIEQNFVKLYAIAKHNSKVTAKQFERFCQEINAQIKPAEPKFCTLFNSRLIESIFSVEEYVFDATKLATWARFELKKYGIKIFYNTCAVNIEKSIHQTPKIVVKNQKGEQYPITCRYLFNCTYSGLNQFEGDFLGTRTRLKQEITEMALVQVPSIFQYIGITLMDGSFFSILPFPARNLHTLSHVRYTPHMSWEDHKNINPYEKLSNYQGLTRTGHMLRDVGRYIPAMIKAQYVESLFEIKTVLSKNENDDGRPILFEKHLDLPGCYSILGGKIDNIYDILEKLDAEPLTTLKPPKSTQSEVMYG